MVSFKYPLVFVLIYFSWVHSYCDINVVKMLRYRGLWRARPRHTPTLFPQSWTSSDYHCLQVDWRHTRNDPGLLWTDPGLKSQMPTPKFPLRIMTVPLEGNSGGSCPEILFNNRYDQYSHTTGTALGKLMWYLGHIVPTVFFRDILGFLEKLERKSKWNSGEVVEKTQQLLTFLVSHLSWLLQ